MSEVPWPLLVPLLVLVAAVFYLSAVTAASRVEHTSTLRLRWLLFLFGLLLCFLAGLSLAYDLHWGRWGRHSSLDDVLSVLFIVLGVITMIAAPFWSRKTLERESTLLTDAPGDIELSAGAGISPAERVRRARERASGAER